MDELMQRLTAEQRERALRIAHKYGIEEGDVTWTLVLMILDGQESKEWAGGAAKAAGEAADRVRDEIRGLPEKIKESAGAGGEAVKKTVEDAGVSAAEEVKKAGIDVGRALVGAIRKEGGDFEKTLKATASSKKDEIVGGWLVALDSAAAKHQAARLWKWASVGMLAGLLLVLFGAWGGWFYFSGKTEVAQAPPPPPLSLDCSGAGEERSKDSNGMPICIRHLPIQ